MSDHRRNVAMMLAMFGSYSSSPAIVFDARTPDLPPRRHVQPVEVVIEPKRAVRETRKLSRQERRLEARLAAKRR